MTNEEKELLLKDICTRLPYGITIYRITDNSTHRIQYSDITENIDQFSHFLEYSGIDNIKPYLRPMSSMTEEEKRELSKKYVWYINCGQIEIRYHSDGYWDDNECPTSEYLNLFDWLNSNYFDYRGLIGMGLAIEAPVRMYNN